VVIFGPQVCGDLDAAATREWLLTDGLGGYAMGTVAGLRTRRYHGLLMIAEPGLPARRRLGLAALDAELLLPAGGRARLATHEWSGGALDPQGHLLLERFELTDGIPRWRWRIGEVVLEREISMGYGTPQVEIVHRLVAAPGPVTLVLKALTTWRDAHAERTAGGPPPAMVPTADGVEIEGAYRLAGPGWRAAGEWYRGVYAREEAARGLSAVEDLWFAGDFTVSLAPGESATVAAFAGQRSAVAARERHRGLTAGASDEVDAALLLAADAFVVRGPDVVAGYPWFGTWSRDTMTSYEGLFLSTGRVEEGRALLRAYAATVSEGMLANTADTGTLEYNTADATLWFLHALDRHATQTGDDDLARDLAGTVAEIIAAHVAGTRYGIRVDPADGLLTQGGQDAPGLALTWMDARVDGVPVTPRAGKAVEINALWINGLGAAAALLGRAGADSGAIDRLRAAAVTGFRRRFAGPAGLPDVLDAGPEVRPNQLLAFSLPHGPRRGDPAPALPELVTPLGLRSLAPGEPAYLGRHRGGPADRDRAYHQGTVWPWLIGPYADATGSAAVPAGLSGLSGLSGLEAHVFEWGLGSVSETAEGDPPHRATGCPFQAWSVAELLRVRRKTR
jgi:predicted glycogen debranching enzyme